MPARSRARTWPARAAAPRPPNEGSAAPRRDLRSRRHAGRFAARFRRHPEEIGLQPGLPILEQLADATPAELERAEAIMRRHERAAIAGATLTDGCADLLGHLAGLQ